MGSCEKFCGACYCLFVCCGGSGITSCFFLPYAQKYIVSVLFLKWLIY